MKQISILFVLIALAMSTFTGCSGGGGGSSSYDVNTTLEDNITVATSKSYIIYALENGDIPSTATMLAQSEGTKVKITRDVESDMMNVYVFTGSVLITEVE